MLNIVLINAFWLSFFVVGLAVYNKFFRASFSLDFKSGKQFKALDLISTFFLSVCVGFSLASIFTILCSLLGLSIWYLNFYIVVSTLLAVLYLAKSYIDISWSRPSKLLFPLLAIFLFDFVISTKVGGYLALDSDAWMHLSKVINISENGMGLTDAHFNTLLDPRYIINLFHNLMASAVSLLGIDADVVWNYSSAFFRILLFSSVYSVAYLVTKGSQKISLLTTISAVFLLSYSSRLAVYPNNIVRVLYVFYIFSLINLLTKQNRASVVAYILSTILVVSSHGPFAVGVLVLNAVLILIVAMYAFLKKKPKIKEASYKVIASLAAGSAILASLPLVSYLTPVNRELKMNPDDIVSYLGLEILDPKFFYSTFIALSLLVVLLWIYREKLNKNILLVGIVAISIFPILAFTPLLFELINTAVPLQLLKRFSGLNFFGKALLAGLAFFMVSSIFDRTFFERNSKKFSRNVTQNVSRNGISFIVLFILIAIGLPQVNKYYVTQRDLNAKGESLIQSIKEATEGVDFNDALVAADADLGYSLAGVRNVELVNSLTGHSAPSSNYDQRKACTDELLSLDPYVRIQAQDSIKPAYYLLDLRREQDRALAEDRSLVLVQNESGNNFALYRVNYDPEVRLLNFSHNKFIQESYCSSFDE